MNLVIDVGNTKVKLAVFENDKLITKETGTIETFATDVVRLNSDFRFNKCIVSSVGRLKEPDFVALSKLVKTVILNSETNVPFKNKYKTPETLGVDRIALVSAAVKNHPNQNCLVIDAGTCITYDFLTAKNNYLGGAISPGLNMRYSALNNFTANLPLLERKASKKITGDTSKKAIHSGVVNGVVFEIDGVIKKYRKKYKDLTVILTGGDANFLSKRLKNSIFANSNFLLEGLNFILEFNSHE